MKQAILVSLSAMCFLLADRSVGQVDWTGNLDTNWFTESSGDTNWAGNVLPALTDDVVIGFGNVELTSNAAGINSLDISGDLPDNTPFLQVFNQSTLVVTANSRVGGAAGLTGRLDITTSTLSPQTVFESTDLTVGLGVGAQGIVNLNGANVTISQELIVGEDGGTGNLSTSTGVDPTQRTNLSATRVLVGSGANANGEIHLTATDFVQQSYAVIGNGTGSSGVLTMEDVDATTGSYNVGYDATSFGSLSTTSTEWELTGYFRVGFEGTGEATFGPNSHLNIITNASYASVILGEKFGSDGVLRISASEDDSASLTTQNQINVGLSGKGELSIEGSASVSSAAGPSPTNSALILGNLPGSEGLLNISQEGVYEAANGSDVIIGYVGKGTADINSGGVLRARDMEIAREAGSEGEVFMTGGNGSLVELDRALFIGGSDTAAGGLARVEVLDDSLILVGEKIQLWKNDSVLSLVSSDESVFGGAVGVGIVEQAILTSGRLSVFEDGLLQGAGTLEGSLTVYNNGVVAPGNSPGILTVTETTKLEEGSILDIEIGGQLVGTEYDQLITDVLESDGGIIRVTLLGLYVPEWGSTFQIVNAGMIDLGTIFFDFTNASLDPGLSWSTDSFEINGSISVIPEPSVACLLGLGSLLFLRRKRA